MNNWFYKMIFHLDFSVFETFQFKKLLHPENKFQIIIAEF